MLGLGWGKGRAAEAAAQPAVVNKECLESHGAEFQSRQKGRPKERVGVRPELVAQSVHATAKGVDCSSGIKETEQGSKGLPAQRGVRCRPRDWVRRSWPEWPGGWSRSGPSAI